MQQCCCWSQAQSFCMSLRCAVNVCNGMSDRSVRERALRLGTRLCIIREAVGQGLVLHLCRSVCSSAGAPMVEAASAWITRSPGSNAAHQQAHLQCGFACELPSPPNNCKMCDQPHTRVQEQKASPAEFHILADWITGSKRPGSCTGSSRARSGPFHFSGNGGATLRLSPIADP